MLKLNYIVNIPSDTYLLYILTRYSWNLPSSSWKRAKKRMKTTKKQLLQQRKVWEGRYLETTQVVQYNRLQEVETAAGTRPPSVTYLDLQVQTPDQTCSQSYKSHNIRTDEVIKYQSYSVRPLKLLDHLIY